MMGNGVLGFLLGAGVGAWVYGKTMSKTGGNAKSAYITAGLVGVVVWIFAWIALGMFLKG